MARSSRRKNHTSLESLQFHEEETMLDLKPLQQAEEIQLKTAEDDDEFTDKNDANIGAPKMNTLVGFIRFVNFGSATTVLFILVLMVMKGDNLWGEDLVQNLLCSVQLIFLSFLSILVYIDNIGTVSFCWREYGELSSLHTDATSSIFILCSNRWLFRLGSGLIFITSLSLSTFESLKHEVLPHSNYWVIGLVSGSLGANIIGALLSICVPSHRIPWLQGRFDTKIVRDDDDVWRKSNRSKRKLDSEDWRRRSSTNTCLWLTHRTIQILGMVLCSTSFLVAMAFHVMNAIITGLSLTDEDASSSEVLETKVILMVSNFACIGIEMGCLFLLIVRAMEKNQRARSGSHAGGTKAWIPMYVWLISPYIFSCSVRQFLDTNHNNELVENMQVIIGNALSYTTMLGWFYLMSLLVVFGLLYILLGILMNFDHISAFCRLNFNRDRSGGRKTIRILDTMASILTLIGLVIGMSSIFIDQFSIEIDPDGVAKEVVESIEDFRTKIDPFQTEVKKLLKAIDKHFTCERVYETLGTGATVTLIASFFPGASSVASVGARSAYYGVRAGNALTNLARKFKRATQMILNISMTGIKTVNFVRKNLKKLILASSSVDIGRLMPLLPPVILGIYVLFGVFWPSRIVFFSAKQRRAHMSNRFTSWTLALIVLIVAVLINTVLLDEIVTLLDDNIAIAKISLKHNLGWKLAMSSSAFALAGTFLNWIVALVLMFKYNDDHQNLTNAEKEWQDELQKRELVTIKTAFGNIYQKRTQLKYLRSRISPWTWVLPILLTLTSVGLGILANYHPKLEMIREPRGPMGRMIDKVFRDIELFDSDEKKVKSDTDDECLPFATLNDVLRDHHNPIANVLLGPVNNFYNLTHKVLSPLKQSIHGFRTQLLLDIDEEVFGGNLDGVWQANNLQYIGLLFTLPRLICLLILIFGCCMATIFKCSMQIMCQSLEPRKIVDAYGKVALFSLLYVLGAQISLFNLLSSFGIPFYHIYVRFGAGFVYDAAADFLLIATYVGMNNEFFFAIPKRKTTVTYTVPGASDPGPNINGQII